MASQWEEIINRAIELRHALHRQPELTWQEFKTAKLIRETLDKAGIPWRACTETGTVATLAPDAGGPHIALRGDIDALPIIEESGKDWTSEKQNHMHACGHDGHTATLMAAAWWLKEQEDSLPGPVSLIFQPAEEGGHGAREMIKEAALEDINAIYGWHNWPGIPFGKAICPDGPIMSANGTFKITLKGKGGHSSQPELTHDPVLAAAAITLNLQQIVSRRLAPQKPAVLSVTYINALSGDTVIPEKTALGGSIRCANTNARDEMNDMIAEIAERTADSYGVTASVELSPRYGATVNHATEAEKIRNALKNELGKNWQDEKIPVPIMASEDFSYYLEEIPGAFALIGADDGSPEHQEPCHSPHYDFNDKLIPIVVRVFSRLAGARVLE